MSNGNKLYEEIHITDKFEFYKNDGSFMGHQFNEQVECLHCGKKFIFNEFKIIRKKTPDGMDFIMCKYFPECNGSLIDFMPVKKYSRAKKKIKE